MHTQGEEGTNAVNYFRNKMSQTRIRNKITYSYSITGLNYYL